MSLNFTDIIYLGKAVPGSGGGGGDQHNLGWYATESALTTAHPTANDGDWAIVGSTDTVWVWDSDTNAWKDSDQKGQVTSVNNQTGAVTLTASDVGALPDNTHIPADPVQADWDEADSSALDYIKNKPTIPAAQVNSDWNANSGVAQILNKPTIPDAIQTSTMPTAGADELGKVYQFIGTTDANYTHGYFYECVSDGGNPATYSWSAINVQAGGGGSSYTAGTGIDITSGVISVTSPTLTNVATGNNSIMIGATSELNRAECVVIGVGAHNRAFSGSTVIVGRSATGSTGCISIGGYTENTSPNSIAIGYRATTSTQNAIQLNCSGNSATNSGSNTFKVANTNGNYEMMSADGTIPTARLTKVNTTVTLAAADWSAGTQTVTVNGITATSVVWVSPDPSDQADYVAGGILCTAQAANSLTFTASTTPTNDIDVVVVAM